MRMRLWSLFVGVFGLAWACWGWAAVPAGAQNPTITFSFTDTSGNALTAVGEDEGAQTVRLVATASAATSSAVTVTVTIGGTGSTATIGTCVLSICSGDYVATSS